MSLAFLNIASNLTANFANSKDILSERQILDASLSVACSSMVSIKTREQ